MPGPRVNLPFFDRIIRSFVISQTDRFPNEAPETQDRIFKRIIRENADTVFCREQGIVRDMEYESFQKTVPLYSYETLFPYIERMIAGEPNVLTHLKVSEYARSSGTTNGRSKFIPTPASYMRGNHLKACRDVVTSYAAAHPRTHMFSGKAVAVVGSMARIPGSSALTGDISALITRAVPWWTCFARPYKKSLALHPEWPIKARRIAQKTFRSPVVTLFGTPTWMLEILELVKAERSAHGLAGLWPELEVFFHGAVSFAPYRKIFEELIGRPVEFREVYNASEGVLAFEDDPAGHPGELLLCTDHDIFYEFIPVVDCHPSGPACRLVDVKPGVPYAIVVTTAGGLWRYQIGDVVVFESIKPYRVRIIGRTTQYINAFGEEMVADNAVRAIAAAAEQTQSSVQAFTAAPTFDAPPAQGAHEWAIEFRTPPDSLDDFTRALDKTLMQLNSDYEAKRAGSIVLAAPIVHSVPSGTFRGYMESRQKLGGQHKAPLLSGDRTALEAILGSPKTTGFTNLKK